jgi:hypothetical protein
MSTVTHADGIAGASPADTADALGVFLRRIGRYSLFDSWSRSRRDIRVEAHLCST